MSPDSSQMKSAVLHALAWLWNALVTSVISGAGLFFIAVVVEYVKQYGRERRELQRQREELERAYILSQSPILPPSITSKGAAIFSSYRNSSAFLSGTAFPRRRSPYIYQPHSVDSYSLHQTMLTQSRDCDWIDYHHSSVEDFMVPGEDVESFSSPHDQEQERNKSSVSIIAERIKIKHGIKTWSGTSVVREKCLNEGVQDEFGALKSPSIISRRDVTNTGESSGASSNPGTSKQEGQNDWSLTLSFQKKLLSDMITNYPFIVPFLKDMFGQIQNVKPQDCATTSREDKTNAENQQALPILASDSVHDKTETTKARITPTKMAEKFQKAREDSKEKIRKSYMKFLHHKKINVNTSPEASLKKNGFPEGEGSGRFRGHRHDTPKVLEKKSSLSKLVDKKPRSPVSRKLSSVQLSSPKANTQRPNSPHITYLKTHFLKTSSQKSGSPNRTKLNPYPSGHSNEQKSNDSPSGNNKIDQTIILQEPDKQSHTPRPVEKVHQPQNIETKSGFVIESAKKKPHTFSGKRKIMPENWRFSNKSRAISMREETDLEDDMFQPQDLNEITYHFSTPFESQRNVSVTGAAAQVVSNSFTQTEGVSPPIAHSHCKIDSAWFETPKGNQVKPKTGKGQKSPIRVSKSPERVEILPVDLSKPKFKDVLNEPETSPTTTDDENEDAATKDILENELAEDIENDNNIALEDVIKKQQKLMTAMKKKRTMTPLTRHNSKAKFFTSANREASWNKTVTRIRNATIWKQNTVSNQTNTNMAVSSNKIQPHGKAKQMSINNKKHKTITPPSVSKKIDSDEKNEHQKQPSPVDQNERPAKTMPDEDFPIKLGSKIPQSFNRQLTKSVVNKNLKSEQTPIIPSQTVPQKLLRKSTRTCKYKKSKQNYKTPRVIYDSKVDTGPLIQGANSLIEVSEHTTASSYSATIIENFETTKIMRPPQHNTAASKSTKSCVGSPRSFVEIYKARSQQNIKKVPPKRLNERSPLKNKTIPLRNSITSRAGDSSPETIKSTGFKVKNFKKPDLKLTKRKGKITIHETSEKKGTKPIDQPVWPDEDVLSLQQCRDMKEPSSESLYTSHSESSADVRDVKDDGAGIAGNRFILKKSVLDEVVEQLKLKSVKVKI